MPPHHQRSLQSGRSHKGVHGHASKSSKPLKFIFCFYWTNLHILFSSILSFELKEPSGPVIRDCKEGKDQHDSKPSAMSVIVKSPFKFYERSKIQSMLKSTSIHLLHTRLTRSSEVHTEQQQWRLLHIQIAQKVESLQKLQEEHRKSIADGKVATVSKGTKHKMHPNCFVLKATLPCNGNNQSSDIYKIYHLFLFRSRKENCCQLGQLQLFSSMQMNPSPC